MDTNSNDNKEVFSQEDIETNKIIAGLAYILFFLPLVAAKDSAFGRFHANQGLILLIVAVVGSFVCALIPFLNLILVPLFSLAVFAFVVLGFLNAYNGKAVELPIIGSFRLIK